MAVALFACFPLISALAFGGPEATLVDHGFDLGRGWSPRQTEPPSLEEFVRRQQQTFSDLILAPDDTCGYVSDSSASPFRLCCDTCTCGFQTTPNAEGKFFCCNTALCVSRIPTTCVDAYTYTILSGCNLNCAADSLIMKCTSSPYTYCNLAEFEGVNVQALYCDTVTVSHTQSIYTTFSGQLGRVFSAFTGFEQASSSTSSSPSTSSATSSSSASSSSTSSSSTTSSTSKPSTTGNTAVQTSTTVIVIQPSSSPDAPLPIGAIVGGSVGGFAFLALIAIGVALFMKHRKHALQSTGPNLPVVGLSDGVKPPEDPPKFNPTVNMAHVPSGPPAGYDPHLSGAATGSYAVQQQQQLLQPGPANSYHVNPSLPELGFNSQQAPYAAPQSQSASPYNITGQGSYILPQQQQWMPEQPLYPAQQQPLPRGSTYSESAGRMSGQAQIHAQQAYGTETQYNQRLSELSGRTTSGQAEGPIYLAHQAQHTELQGPVIGPGQSTGLGRKPGPPSRTYTNPDLVPAPLSISGTARPPVSSQGITSTNAGDAVGVAATDAVGSDVSRHSIAGQVPGTDRQSLGSVPRGARMSSPHELDFMP